MALPVQVLTMSSKCGIEGSGDGQNTCAVAISQINCDICSKSEENESMLTCVQCGETFCQSCAMYHRKMKATRDHQLDPITDQSQANKQNVACYKHDNAIAEYFCIQCNSEICKECRDDDDIHDGHDVMLFDELTVQSRNNLKHAVGNTSLRYNLITAEYNMNELLTLRENTESACTNNIEKIQKRFQELYTQINKLCESFCQEVKLNMQKKVQLIDDDKANIQKHFLRLTDAMNEGKLILSRSDDLAVIKQGKELVQQLQEKSCLETKLCELDKMPNPKFGSIEIKDDDLRVLIGKITIGNVGQTPSILNCLFSFEADRSSGGTIKCFAIDGNDTIWVACGETRQFDLFDFKGVYYHSVTVSCRTNNFINDITCDASGDCFCTLTGSQEIYSLSNAGKVHSLINVATHVLFPRGVYFNNNKKILFFCANKSVNSVECYQTTDGKCQLSNGYCSGDKNGIFKLVHGSSNIVRINKEQFDIGFVDKITVNSSGKICVTETYNRRVIIFTPDGEANTFYSGLKTDTQLTFCPLDVTTDVSDQFVVLSQYGFIHILSESGNLLKLFHLQDKSPFYDYPCSMILKNNKIIVSAGRTVIVFAYPHEQE